MCADKAFRNKIDKALRKEAYKLEDFDGHDVNDIINVIRFELCGFKVRCRRFYLGRGGHHFHFVTDLP